MSNNTLFSDRTFAPVTRCASWLLVALAVGACGQNDATTAGDAAAQLQPKDQAAQLAAAVSEVATDTIEAVDDGAATLPALTEFAAVWGPELGSTAPAIAAQDHTGRAQTLASLSGERGLLLVFSRSADW